MKKLFGSVVVLACFSMVSVAQPIGMFSAQTSVGDDAFAGAAAFNNGVYEIEGSGRDIWDVPDGFYWVYMEFSGDFLATATVEWLTDANGGDTWKKAGIIARNTTDDPTRPDGEYACSALIKGNFSNFFVRPTIDSGEEDVVDGRDADISGKTFTIQLKREGNIFSMLRGLVSGGFELEGAKEIVMNDKIVLGLCVTSHNTAAIEAASFSAVTITQNSAIQDFSLYE